MKKRNLVYSIPKGEVDLKILREKKYINLLVLRVCPGNGNYQLHVPGRRKNFSMFTMKILLGKCNQL